MVILETNRLSIEEASLADSDFFYKLLNSPNWIKYIGDRGIYSREDAASYIENSLIHSYSILGYGLYKMVIRKSGTPIGICGFLKRDLEHPDIGFAILPEFERKGYTLEAVVPMMSYGFNQLGFGSILAITSDENVGSQKLLEKVGLRSVGNVKPSEDAEDLLLYSASV